jgi:acyl phosphate:glycerol-3-phosphate acyltransferase
LLTWALAPISYVLGMFPSAAIVARSAGVDVSAQGSGNPGASNVTRLLGWKRGVLVFFLDAAKGAIAAALGLIFVGRSAGYICGAAAILGHMFPAMRRFGSKRFQGGKGVATGGGAMFVLQPIVTPILALVWFAMLKLTKRASIASITIVVLLPVGALAVGSPAWEILAILGLGALVLLKHTDNIKRLVRREELSLGKNP